MTLQEWLDKHEQEKLSYVRLGQRFIIEMNLLNWPELFYETNDEKSIAMIRAWCNNMNYTDSLPIMALVL